MKKAWAIIWPDGRILADSDFKDEAEAWQVALGWPDDKEISIAKRRGYKAAQVSIGIPPVPQPAPNDDTKRAPKLFTRPPSERAGN
jgi:hypothetical protein